MKTLIKFLTLILAASALVFSQTDKEEAAKEKIRIINLKNGINSENPGLKESSIKMAGKYKIKEVIPDLMMILKTDDDPEIKMLTALTIYSIGEKRSMTDIYSLSKTEKNLKLKKLYDALYFVYNKDNHKTDSL